MARRQSGGKIDVDDRTLGILSTFRCTGNVAHAHAEKLERADYLRMNAILEALGGRWQKSSKALPGGGHVFPEVVDAAERIEAALLTGSVDDPKADDFFPTPVELARRMVELARVVHGSTVLEPSAGGMRLVDAILAAGATNVRACEINVSRRQAILARMGDLDVGDPSTFGPLSLMGHDFLSVDPHPDRRMQEFDAVVMNPPFSREQDALHVMHALRFLKPSGTLVAVTSPSWRFRQTKTAEAMRAAMQGAEVEELPPGTFKESGTLVRSLLVVVRGR